MKEWRRKCRLTTVRIQSHSPLTTRKCCPCLAEMVPAGPSAMMATHGLESTNAWPPGESRIRWGEWISAVSMAFSSFLNGVWSASKS